MLDATRSALMLPVLLTLVLLGGALSPAVALEWAPMSGLSSAMQLRMQHVRRSRCLPRDEELTLPAYPNAVVIKIDWGRVRPDCAARDGWAELGAVTLLSVDDETSVAAWYAQALAGHAQYPSARGLLFIAAHIDAFLYDRDYYKYSNVAISRASGEWDAAGYRTRIELNRPAPPKPGAQ